MVGPEGGRISLSPALRGSPLFVAGLMGANASPSGLGCSLDGRVFCSVPPVGSRCSHALHDPPRAPRSRDHQTVTGGSTGKNNGACPPVKILPHM